MHNDTPQLSQTCNMAAYYYTEQSVIPSLCTSNFRHFSKLSSEDAFTIFSDYKFHFTIVQGQNKENTITKICDESNNSSKQEI